MSSQQKKTSKTTTSLPISEIGLDHMKDIRHKVQNKWDSTGFLSGLENKFGGEIPDWSEIPAGPLVDRFVDMSTRPKKTRWERFKSWFNRVILRKEPDLFSITFPLVKRVVSQTTALDLVPVVPMNLPVGQLMFLDLAFTQDINFLIEGI